MNYFHNFLIIVISFSLSLSSFAQNINSHKYNQLKTLNESFLLTKGPIGEEISPLIFKENQKFITNPANRDILSSELGDKFLSQQKVLGNYLVAKKKFEDCIKDKESKRFLDQRILESLKNSDNTNLDCKEELFHFKTIEDLSKHIFEVFENDLKYQTDVESNKYGIRKKQSSKKLSIKALRNLQEELYTQSLQNSFATYLDLRFKYEQNFSREQVHSKPQMVINKFCLKSDCNEQSKKILRKHLKSFFNEKEQQEKISFSEAAKKINKKVEKLNKLLSKVDSQIKTKGGFFKLGFWDSSDADFDEEAKLAFDEYIKTYLHEASSGAGLLLVTDHMREKFGGLKSTSDSDLNEKTKYGGDTKFTFKKHRPITSSDVKFSKQEVQAKILDQVSMLTELHNKKNKNEQEWLLTNKGANSTLFGPDSENIKKQRENDLKKLIKTNPSAVGQILAKNPAYSKTVCSLINQINTEDISDDKWNKAFMWGGVIVGGALLVTGIGSAVGAGILAGTASGLALSSIATGAFWTATAFGVYEAGRYSKKALDYHNELIRTQNAFLSGSGDHYSMLEARDLLLNFEKERLSAFVALGFSAVDLGSLSNIAKIGSIGAKGVKSALSAKEMKSLTSVYKKISNTPKLANLIIQGTQEMGKKSIPKINEFLEKLAAIGDSSRKMILEGLSSSSFTPLKLKKMINNALEVGKACAI